MVRGRVELDARDRDRAIACSRRRRRRARRRTSSSTTSRSTTTRRSIPRPPRPRARQHLKDYTDLTADIAAGTLPSVVFYKPEGDLNQHSGYASIAAGDEHIADLVAKLQASAAVREHDHRRSRTTRTAAGGITSRRRSATCSDPGTRIPAIIVSPYAKTGFVDHTQYDTGSILRLIDKRFGITPLPGLAARDAALAANGETRDGRSHERLDVLAAAVRVAEVEARIDRLHRRELRDRGTRRRRDRTRSGGSRAGTRGRHRRGT